MLLKFLWYNQYAQVNYMSIRYGDHTLYVCRKQVFIHFKFLVIIA